MIFLFQIFYYLCSYEYLAYRVWFMFLNHKYRYSNRKSQILTCENFDFNGRLPVIFGPGCAGSGPFPEREIFWKI